MDVGVGVGLRDDVGVGVRVTAPEDDATRDGASCVDLLEIVNEDVGERLDSKLGAFETVSCEAVGASDGALDPDTATVRD